MQDASLLVLDAGNVDPGAALQKKGYPVIAPANPLRGLSSDADHVGSVLQTTHGPIVLVGHSYGGAVITNAAVGVPNVEALVYIAAFAPDAVDSLQQPVTMNPGTHITPDALDTRPHPLPGGGTGTDLYIKAKDFRDAFAGDLPRKTTNLMEAEQRPFLSRRFTEPSGDPAWKTTPSWYPVATNDHAIPPKTQRFMAHRAGSVISHMAASHVPMQSQPRATLAPSWGPSTQSTDPTRHGGHTASGPGGNAAGPTGMSLAGAQGLRPPKRLGTKANRRPDDQAIIGVNLARQGSIVHAALLRAGCSAARTSCMRVTLLDGHIDGSVRPTGSRQTEQIRHYPALSGRGALPGPTIPAAAVAAALRRTLDALQRAKDLLGQNVKAPKHR